MSPVAAAMVSAHEYGSRLSQAGRDPRELIDETLLLAPDYVECDVRRTVDGVFVVRHDPTVGRGRTSRRVAELSLEELHAADPWVLTFDELLERVRGCAKIHLDLKFSGPGSSYDGPSDQIWEIVATARAVDMLGAGQVVVTTGRDRVVAALGRWREAHHPDLLVGLTLGGSRRTQSWRRQIAGRWSEFFPARRMAACRADVVVANYWLARLGVARWTDRHDLRLLVWTVDSRRGLRRWLADPRCWMVTTNHVRRAVRIRDGYRD